MLCHIRLASISSRLVVGNLIHSFDCATMLFTTLSTVRDTVACLSNTKFLTNTLLISRVTEMA
ncbi:unnamed protein product [Acanthoscelides obtectus]|uniref:Uncharacterized protein n=1 Tax=Acanthoscelides obtectus TaxID=200917 RepID=A0A9P0P3U9_ACAOB|nr:unnamed protein product [Acanthoscelides obtectus]CAK1631613.1 hypothetical protein AOBTE_LOCUS7047 [Acanthoscelides obtectus]